MSKSICHIFEIPNKKKKFQINVTLLNGWIMIITCENVTIMGMIMVWSVVMVFTILIEWHVLKTSWLDVVRLVFFLPALVMQAF